MRNKNDLKREYLFDKYSDNLKLLQAHNILKVELPAESIYICPICLRNFTKEDLKKESENPLTLEDAPPKSLGGSQIVLTCEECNNGLGRDIDWHLTERLKELEFREQIPGAEQNGKFHLNGLVVNGKIVVLENGNTNAVLPKKINNPKTLDSYINLITQNRNLIPEFKGKKTRVDSKKLQIAVLKNGYLLMFEKFGYSIIFNSEYDRIRKQLLNPQEDIYPLNCWLQGPFPEERIGVPFITEKELESIFTLFKLKTKLIEKLFAVILPFSDSKIETTIEALNKKFSVEKNFDVKMELYTDDYLKDINSIKMLLNWMSKFKQNVA